MPQTGVSTKAVFAAAPWELTHTPCIALAHQVSIRGQYVCHLLMCHAAAADTACRWAWLAVDLVRAAVGTDYARVVRAVYILAQVSKPFSIA